MKRLFICVMLLVSCVLLHAQHSRMFTVSSGLVSGQVDAIFQDSKGFIWITSGYGLVRYDGSNFEQFHHIEGNPYSLSSDNAHFVLEDHLGTIWVATEHGLDIYDEERNSFTNVPLPVLNPDVTCLVEGESDDSGSLIYCNVLNHGIYAVDAVSHKTDSLLTHKLQDILGLGRGPVFLDSEGILWKDNSSLGLKAFDTRNGYEQEISWDSVPETVREEINVSSIEEDTVTSNLYISTRGNGIFFVDRSTYTVSYMDHSYEGSFIESMQVLRQGSGSNSLRLLVGTEDDGLRIYDVSRRSYVDDGSSLSPYCNNYQKIHDILQDRQGNLWLAAYYSGIIMIPDQMYGFSSLKFDPRGTPGSNVASVTTVTEDPRRGYTYVGTDGAGLFRISQDGKVLPFNSGNSGLTNDLIKSLAMDNSGRLWIGTYLGGLFVYDEKEGFRHFHGNDDLGSEQIWNLAYDKESDVLYVGTLGRGLHIVDPDSERVTTSVSAFSRRWARSTYIDSNGKLWIGTDSGVVYFDPTVGQVMDYEMSSPCDDSPVNAFCESSDGTLWIGYRGGVVALDRSSRHTRTWTEDDGLNNSVIKDILEGPDGDIWIATQDGLSKLDPKTARITNYHEYDGLPGNEFVLGSSFLSSDKRMYFGGMDGLTAFYPHLINMRNRRLADLHLSRLTMMNDPVDYDPIEGKSNLLDAHVTVARRVFVPRKYNVISLGFSTTEYANPSRVRYDCFMSRCDKVWRTVENGKLLSYTNLRPGAHTLSVKAYYEGDIENYVSKEFTVKVQAPWYLTFWAFLFYLAAVSVFVYYLVRYKIRKAARAKEARKAETDKMRLEMFSNITHEIRTPLFLVMSPLKKLRETENNPAMKDTYNLMYRNTLRVQRIVNQLMDLRKVDEGKLALHFKRTDIIFFIRDIMKSFENLAQSKSVELSMNTQVPELDIWIDHGNFDKIIFNILSNAFKFTPDGGKIDIGVKDENESVEIRIHNTGSHIKDDDTEKVFDRFFQSPGYEQFGGSGVGLSLTRQLVELHHGSISAENTDDGVAFIITIPKGCEHLTEEELSPTDHHKDLYIKSESLIQGDDNALLLQTSEDTVSSDSRIRKHLVVVDDDPDSRHFIKMTFSDYNVDAFVGGDEAWGTISTSNVDAVITDLHMAGMDGYSLCRKVRKNPNTAHIPLIVLTSVDDEVSEQICSDLGADRYFLKPVSTELLRSAVAQAISARESVRMKMMNTDMHDYSSVKVTHFDEKLKLRVLDAINDNYSDSEFGVEELSAMVGISRVHLNRKLKSIMGVSPSALLKNTRLKQAAYLLAESEHPSVSEIAYKVGFSNQAYFSVAFHEYFGLTPSEFALQYSGGNKAQLEHLFE